MPFDPWMMDASGGAPSYTAGEVRLTTVTPHFAGAGAPLGVRSGVRSSGSNIDMFVQAQGTPNMSVLVPPGAVIVQGAISTTQGAYTWVLDTVTVLVVAAAHATLARTDLVCVRIRDASVDTSGQRDAAVTIITGTAGAGIPSLPTDATYFTLAQVTVRSVSAGGGTIVSGDVADKRLFTAALGGTIPCTSTTRPAGIALGQSMYETDTGLARTWDGTIWRLDSPLRRKTVLNATTSSVTFSFPNTLSQIRLNIAARSTKAALSDDIAIRLNSDSTSGSYRWVYRFAVNGVPPNVTNSFSDTLALIGTIPAGSTPSGYFGATEAVLDACNGVQAMIPYTAHSAFVTDTAYVINDCGGTYWPTGNISSVTILSSTGASFVTNSTFTLWGWE